MLVLNANLGTVKTLTKKEFIEEWGFLADSKLFQDIWDCAADSGYYAFTNKRDAVIWCLEESRYYADLSPERTKNILDILSHLLANGYDFQVLTAKNC